MIKSYGIEGDGRTGPPATREAILDAAETLFAEKGIQGVSVRSILGHAGLNVALAHYHFGGRDGLIREVLRRRIEPLNASRLERLRAVEAAAQPGFPSIEDLLQAFLEPAVELLGENPQFARLLGRLHVNADVRLRAFFLEEFGEVIRRFTAAFDDALRSRISPGRRLCRGHFVLGVLVLTLTNYNDLELMSASRDGLPLGRELLEEMVAFCAAGLRASVSGPGARRRGRHRSV